MTYAPAFAFLPFLLSLFTLPHPPHLSQEGCFKPGAVAAFASRHAAAMRAAAFVLVPLIYNSHWTLLLFEWPSQDQPVGRCVHPLFMSVQPS